MKIKIDGKEILVSDVNKNIVEIADENGIGITAPCFKSKKKNGCCNACVIEINKEQKFACGSKPYEGMNVIYKRDDLEKIRKGRLAKYAQAIKNIESDSASCCGTDINEEIKNNSSCDCTSTSCCD